VKPEVKNKWSSYNTVSVFTLLTRRVHIVQISFITPMLKYVR